MHQSTVEGISAQVNRKLGEFGCQRTVMLEVRRQNLIEKRIGQGGVSPLR
jgi:hypothetical protein